MEAARSALTASSHCSPSTEVKLQLLFLVFDMRLLAWIFFLSLLSEPEESQATLQDLGVLHTLTWHRGQGLSAHCSLLPPPTSSLPSCPAQRADVAVLHDSIDITPRLLVTATCRFALPSSITSMTSSGLDTNLSVHPCKSQRQGRSAITAAAKQQHLKAAKHPFSL